MSIPTTKPNQLRLQSSRPEESYGTYTSQTQKATGTLSLSHMMKLLSKTAAPGNLGHGRGNLGHEGSRAPGASTRNCPVSSSKSKTPVASRSFEPRRRQCEDPDIRQTFNREACSCQIPFRLWRDPRKPEKL